MELALSLLFILFVSLFVLGFLSVVLLITVRKPKLLRAVIWMTTIFCAVLTVINATSYPSNFIVEQIIAWILGGISLIGLRLHYKQKNRLAKACIVFSIVASIYQLFFI